MITTKKHPCKPHAYQDKTYGSGKRVFTEKKDGNLRCTVCAAQQSR